MNFYDYIRVSAKFFKKFISDALGLESNLSNYEIVQLDLDEIDHFMEQKLKNFEQQFTYPFDNKCNFRIKHGCKNGDYFKFFKDMGECVCYVAFNNKNQDVNDELKLKEKTQSFKKKEIAAVACGVLRKIPQKNKKPIKVWYICDFKVSKKFRGEKLSLKLFNKAILDGHIFKSMKGYGICMDPSDKSEPTMIKIWRKNSFLNPKMSKINIYNFSYEQINNFKSKLESILCHKPIAFKSMKRIKDFEIFNIDNQKTPRIWNLLHIQHGTLGEKKIGGSIFDSPKKDHDHMIATIAQTQLDKALRSIYLSEVKVVPQSSATLLYYGLSLSFFNDKILTNHI